MAEETLDLTSPGELWATAENFKSVTFHLVDPAAGYDKARLQGNPAVNPNDDLMRPFTVTPENAKDGECKCDLAQGARGAEIMAKLTERYARGTKRLEKIRALYVAQAKADNRLPDRVLAEVKDFVLKPIPSLTLTPAIHFLTVRNFIANQKHFHAQLAASGMDEVELTTTPKVKIAVVGGASGDGAVKLKVEEGKKYVIHLDAPFKKREEQKQELVERQYISYNRPMPWNAWGEQSRAWVAQKSGQKPERYLPGKFTREVWDGGIVTLRASGAGLVKSISATAEAWAASWLLKEPPPPFLHNVC